MLQKVRKKSARQKQYDMVGWLFCAPAIVFGTVFLVVPILLAFGFSFTDYHMLRGITRFVWFENYAELFKDEVFHRAILNTLQFVIFVVPLQLGMALAFALLVNSRARGFGIFKLAYFAPVITSMTVIALLFKNFYGETGLFNVILRALGFSAQGFLNDPDQAMGSIIVMSAWQGAGYQMIILLAALQNVPQELYEAGSLDGAKGFTRFKSITLPCITDVASFVFLITLIGAFKLFTQPYIMPDTPGGPDYSTMTIVLYIYERGMTDKLIGYGSSIAMLFTAAFIVINSAAKWFKKLSDKYRVNREKYIEERI